MNLTRAQKVRLGVFLLSGSLLTVAAVGMLAGVRMFERRDFYTVRFAESVGGLSPSAQVKYRGLRVGRVEDMRIPEEAPELVEVTLSLSPETPLYEGVQAMLDTSGLTGLKTINLQGGDPTKSRLLPGATIPAGPSFLGRITGQAEQIAMKVEVIVNQLAQWTGADSRRRIERLLEGIDGLARESTVFLRDTREPMNSALIGVSRASQVVADLSADGRATLASFNAEMAATLQGIRRPLEDIDPERVRGTLDATEHAMVAFGARMSTAEAGKLLTELDKTVQEMTRVVQALELVVRAGREDFVSTLSYLRQAAEDIREFSRIVAQDPSTLLRGKETQQ